MSRSAGRLRRSLTAVLLVLLVAGVAVIAGMTWFRLASDWARTCPIPPGREAGATDAGAEAPAASPAPGEQSP
jgi:hypothetical protein